jgi:hypothetical protein
MASANEPADIRIVAEDPFGNQYVVHTARSDGAINAGKSPDGVLANLTHDKQVKLPVGGPVLVGGWKVRLLVNLDATDGLDVSDGVFQVAVTDATGAERQLSASDLGITTDFPAASPASSWLELGSGYTVPNGQRLRIGSLSLTTPTVVSVEDDT